MVANEAPSIYFRPYAADRAITGLTRSCSQPFSRRTWIVTNLDGGLRVNRIGDDNREGDFTAQTFDINLGSRISIL